MITIDEAIANEKEMSVPCSTPCTDNCNCTECRKSHEQLAEWLEELKANRIALAKASKALDENARLGYNKAIDDLLKNANEMSVEVDMVTYSMKSIGIGLLEQIAEQLKAGGTDE